METRILKVFVSLGVPGLALGVFYLLFKGFHWDFPAVPRPWVGPIVVLFMLMSSGIVYYTLRLWSPKTQIAGPTLQTNAAILQERNAWSVASCLSYVGYLHETSLHDSAALSHRTNACADLRTFLKFFRCDETTFATLERLLDSKDLMEAHKQRILLSEQLLRQVETHCGSRCASIYLLSQAATNLMVLEDHRFPEETLVIYRMSFLKRATEFGLAQNEIDKYLNSATRNSDHLSDVVLRANQ